MIKKWFSQELSDNSSWDKYKQMIHKYIGSSDSFLRIPIYKMHLDFLSNPKYNTQYSHTIEFLFVREETSKNKDPEKLYNLKQTLLLKYHVETEAKKEDSTDEKIVETSLPENSELNNVVELFPSQIEEFTKDDTEKAS